RGAASARHWGAGGSCECQHQLERIRNTHRPASALGRTECISSEACAGRRTDSVDAPPRVVVQGDAATFEVLKAAHEQSDRHLVSTETGGGVPRADHDIRALEV